MFNKLFWTISGITTPLILLFSSTIDCLGTLRLTGSIQSIWAFCTIGMSLINIKHVFYIKISFGNYELRGLRVDLPRTSNPWAATMLAAHWLASIMLNLMLCLWNCVSLMSRPDRMSTDIGGVVIQITFKSDQGGLASEDECRPINEEVNYLLAHLSPRLQCTFEQPHQILDVLVVVFDSTRTPTIYVPEGRVDDHDVRVRAVRSLKNKRAKTTF